MWIATRWADAAGFNYTAVPLKVTMRTAPTVTLYSPAGTSGNWYDQGGGNKTSVATNIADSEFNVQLQGSVVGSTGQMYGHFTASAEL